MWTIESWVISITENSKKSKLNCLEFFFNLGPMAQSHTSTYLQGRANQRKPPPQQKAKNNRLRDRQEEVGSHSNFGLVANWASQQPPSVYKRLAIRRRKESVFPQPPFLRGCNGYLGFGGALWGGKGGSSLLTFKKVYSHRIVSLTLGFWCACCFWWRWWCWYPSLCVCVCGPSRISRLTLSVSSLPLSTYI